MKTDTALKISPGQMKELSSAIVGAVPTDLPSSFAQYWIGKKGDLNTIIENILRHPFYGKETLEIIGWQKFYKKFFGIELDPSSIRIPEKQSGFDRLIIVPKGLTLNQVYDKCAENFSCSRYADDLDKEVILNDRDPNKGSYAIWVRDRIEADEELKNLSADDLEKKKIPGITFIERLLYELAYWAETGKHLDIQNWTLCAGSRGSGGAVPRVHWVGDGLRVHWSHSDDLSGLLRARAAVS